MMIHGCLCQRYDGTDCWSLSILACEILPEVYPNHQGLLYLLIRLISSMGEICLPLVGSLRMKPPSDSSDSCPSGVQGVLVRLGLRNDWGRDAKLHEPWWKSWRFHVKIPLIHQELYVVAITTSCT